MTSAEELHIISAIGLTCRRKGLTFTHGSNPVRYESNLWVSSHAGLGANVYMGHDAIKCLQVVLDYAVNVSEDEDFDDKSPYGESEVTNCEGDC